MTDSWKHLREFTAARIALGRAGGSLPTAPLLDFRLSHARARDAVLCHFDPETLATSLRRLTPDVHILQSEAENRAVFLQRPDRGRRLSEASRLHLETLVLPRPADLVILISDGLSTIAAMQQAEPLLSELLPLLGTDGWSLAPLMVVRHGRVAIQDEVGGILNARLSLILLGERPGLGSPDSLGAYFTYAPMPGKTDADRNCVSNIRPQGLPPAAAARKLHSLLTNSRQLALSGVHLKDETPAFSPVETSPLPAA